MVSPPECDRTLTSFGLSDRQARPFVVVRRSATSLQLGATGRTMIIHVHYKPLHEAIGEPDILAFANAFCHARPITPFAEPGLD